MELTSKQRAQLRSLASTLDTIIHIGKDGISDNLVKQADDALEARELIKGKVLENSMLTAREAAEELKRSKTQIETVFYDWLLEELTAEERQTFALLLHRLYARSKQERREGFPHVIARLEETEGDA